MVVLGGVGVSDERGTPVWSDINLRVVTFPHSGLRMDVWAEIARKSVTLSVGTLTSLRYCLPHGLWTLVGYLKIPLNISLLYYSQA